MNFRWYLTDSSMKQENVCFAWLSRFMLFQRWINHPYVTFSPDLWPFCPILFINFQDALVFDKKIFVSKLYDVLRTFFLLLLMIFSQLYLPSTKHNIQGQVSFFAHLKTIWVYTQASLYLQTWEQQQSSFFFSFFFFFFLFFFFFFTFLHVQSRISHYNDEFT